MTRADAAARTLVTLRFFWNSPQSEQPDATGYKGFYYHFLDMKTGKRVWQSEVSLIDTTLLLAGVLTASVYFSEDTPSENEIRERADAIYRRVDWQWACGGAATARQGWKPESGFLHYGWEGYDEATILYVLGLASPTHPLPEDSYIGVDRDLSVGEHLRLRVSLCRAALHSSVLPGMDRFRRHTRSLHAREGQRLFRKQPARHLCPARIRAAQSARIRRLWQGLLGHHGERRARLQDAEDRWQGTPLSRLCRARRALWARRRHDRPMRDACVAAVRARACLVGVAPFLRALSRDDSRVRDCRAASIRHCRATARPAGSPRAISGSTRASSS